MIQRRNILVWKAGPWAAGAWPRIQILTTVFSVARNNRLAPWSWLVWVWWVPSELSSYHCYICSLVEQFWSPSTWSVFIYTIFYHLHVTSCYHLLLYRWNIWAKLTWTIQNPKWICIFFVCPWDTEEDAFRSHLQRPDQTLRGAQLGFMHSISFYILYVGCHINFHNITDSTVARWSGEADGETSRDISVRLFGDIWGDHPCSPLKQLCIDRFWQEELWTESKQWQALVEEDHSKLSSWISIDFHNCVRNSLPIPRGHDFTNAITSARSTAKKSSGKAGGQTSIQAGDSSHSKAGCFRCLSSFSWVVTASLVPKVTPQVPEK